MPFAVEPKTISDILTWEVDQNYSREVVTIASGRWLPIGTVLGKITASGLYVALNPAATDGSQTAAAVLLADVDAYADIPALAAMRMGILKASGLGWPAGITPEQKAAAISQLQALGLLVRDTV